MRNQPKTPQFTCGHELLDAATTELAVFLEAVGELNRVKDWAKRNIDELVPTRWTKQIEEAVGDELKLTALRVVHSEKSLTLASILLQEGVVRAAVWERREVLSALLEKLVVAHDDEKGNGHRQSRHMQRLLQSAVVTIDQALRNADLTNIETRQVEERGKKAIREAAAVVAGIAKQRSYWTDELVVKGRDYQHYLNPDVELRCAVYVALRDKDGRWPKAAALYDALVRLEAALKELRAASSDLRSENGSVNEYQHASRLVGQLYGEGCGGLNKKVIDDQDDRRIAYSLKFSRFGVLLDAFRTLRAEACHALVAACFEAERMKALDNTPRMATSREVIDVEMRALNNLVAADEMLRRFGRELKEHEKTAGDDYSNGKGTSATDAEFERIAQFKRPKKSA